MKKLGLVVLLTLFPIYRFVTWILIFNELEFATQAERVKAYHEQYFFGNSTDERQFLSSKTVDSHRTNTMRKLGVHNVAELVRYAIKHKIVALDY